jgi:hypothetical protein
MAGRVVRNAQAARITLPVVFALAVVSVQDMLV